MKRDYLEKCIGQLDGMIATIQQAVVIGGRSERESEACDLLKDARLKLLEEIDFQEEHLNDGWSDKLAERGY